MFARETHAQTPVIPTYSGNDLLHDCTDDNAITQKSFCLGFIMGIWDAAVVEEGVVHPSKSKFVIPEEANLGQLKDVVVKYLIEHPAQRHLNAGLLVVIALKETFPPHP
jgi:hypothetical protein